MEGFDDKFNMCRALQDPTIPIGERPILDPKIPEEKLELLYSQMANIHLQLSRLKMPKIGSLLQDKDGIINVNGRPLIGDMQQIICHNGAPQSTLPPQHQKYTSADEWYRVLSDLHITQVALQHNDAVDDEGDARDKYVSRQLFRNLAAKNKLVPDDSKFEGDFRLFSEDFRPTNVLLDKEFKVIAVIDWEWAYSAPASFSFDPPWWLLIRGPESWPGGICKWKEAYEPRLKTFLRVLEAEEAKMAATTNLASDIGKLSLQGRQSKVETPLSQRMRESWKNGAFFLNYVARRCWDFDFIWWKFLDEKYFGPNEDQDHKCRLSLLTKPPRNVMDSFVARKMKEKNDRKVMEWGEKLASELLAEVLV